MEQDTLSARSCAAWGPGSVGGGIQESGSALSALSGGRGSGVGVSVGGHVLGWGGSQAGGAGPAAAVSGRAKGGVGGRVPVRSGVQPSPGTGVGALNANGGRGGGRPARTLSGGREVVVPASAANVLGGAVAKQGGLVPLHQRMAAGEAVCNPHQERELVPLMPAVAQESADLRGQGPH
ncbi:unnamed protein product [Ectocarpus sp. CCAP 1310/34]|nr:unnamed protein product [Ectocarpus sp. CCAP 1310/34]CAB1116637.1 unnamed protein product [Ectocarpus sp. CCAP 1310/34]